MDWQLALSAELDGGSVSLALDDPVDVVCILFRDVLNPSLKIIDGCIAIPHQYTIVVSCCMIVYQAEFCLLSMVRLAVEVFCSISFLNLYSFARYLQ